MAAEIIAELGLSHVRLQFDLYHTQCIGGDVTVQMRTHMVRFPAATSVALLAHTWVYVASKCVQIGFGLLWFLLIVENG
jgi:hypothetical protein